MVQVWQYDSDPTRITDSAKLSDAVTHGEGDLKFPPERKRRPALLKRPTIAHKIRDDELVTSIDSSSIGNWDRRLSADLIW